MNTILILHPMLYAQDIGFQFPGALPSAPQAVTGSQPEQWQKPQEPSITTKSDDNRGNWYYKQRVFKESKLAYDRIKSRVSEIEKLQGDFFSKRSAIDKEVSGFYKDIGFEQKDVEHQVGKLLKEVEDDRQKLGQISEPEREVLLELNATKQQLEQLQGSFQQIRTLDSNLDKVMSTVMEQINTARNYKQKAWHNYEAISETLSDQKAERLYLEIKNFANGLDAIKTYLTGNLNGYVTQLSDTLKSLMAQTRTRLNDLQKKGISLGKSIHEQEQAQEEARAEEEKRKREAAQAKKKVEESQSWWAYIKGWFTR